MNDILKPNPEIQRELDRAKSPLALYAKELKRRLEMERQQSWEAVATNRRLQAELEAAKSSLSMLNRRNEDLADAYFDTVVRLTRASEYKDPEAGAHVVRMSHYAETVALHLDLGRGFASLIHAAAPMHDVGKIGVPDPVLLKDGPLDEDEWEMMKKHTVIGARLLEGSKSPLLEMARQIALTHHERWDGSGYPAGIEGDEIPMAGRIVMLADCYDAIRSERPYKTSHPHTKACDQLLTGDQKMRPDHFDPKLLAAFAEIHEQFDNIFRLFQD